MTTEQFRLATNRARVQLVAGGPHGPGGLFVTGLSQEELAEIVTLAGRQVGEVREDARVNPEWLALGPKANIEFLFHPSVLASQEPTTP